MRSRQKVSLTLRKLSGILLQKLVNDDPVLKFDAKTCKVILKIDPQSPNISQGVTISQTQKEQGAGDQGIDVWICNK